MKTCVGYWGMVDMVEWSTDTWHLTQQRCELRGEREPPKRRWGWPVRVGRIEGGRLQLPLQRSFAAPSSALSGGARRYAPGARGLAAARRLVATLPRGGAALALGGRGRAGCQVARAFGSGGAEGAPMEQPGRREGTWNAEMTQLGLDVVEELLRGVLEVRRLPVSAEVVACVRRAGSVEDKWFPLCIAATPAPSSKSGTEREYWLFNYYPSWRKAGAVLMWVGLQGPSLWLLDEDALPGAAKGAVNIPCKRSGRKSKWEDYAVGPETLPGRALAELQAREGGDGGKALADWQAPVGMLQVQAEAAARAAELVGARCRLTQPTPTTPWMVAAVAGAEGRWLVKTAGCKKNRYGLRFHITKSVGGRKLSPLSREDFDVLMGVPGMEDDAEGVYMIPASVLHAKGILRDPGSDHGGKGSFYVYPNGTPSKRVDLYANDWLVAVEHAAAVAEALVRGMAEGVAEAELLAAKRAICGEAQGAAGGEAQLGGGGEGAVERAWRGAEQWTTYHREGWNT
ncbi:hypothetical protein CYMTET_43733 [Cymbomonas tetramitiformis]|uniref:Uncharacterized protein n=1 Tax=Cymbomonas tetramitiformis TaxID=36881 RepID=A0AAE0F0C5_9CHLO|nr:hypothetical protein CYMTET_43733 [Cymbomonas tetramitiformis]